MIEVVLVNGIVTALRSCVQKGEFCMRENAAGSSHSRRAKRDGDPKTTNWREDLIKHETGYFDHVAAILGAYQHPIIVVEEAAMRWMGLRVTPAYSLDLLIKDCQLDGIIADLLATGLYERVEQDLNYRLNDPGVKQVPLLRRIDGHYFPDRPLSLWAESVYMLSTTTQLVEVLAPIALNINLVECRFDPVPSVFSVSTQTKLAAGVKILPQLLALSSDFKCPVYIPSIPRFHRCASMFH
ncbi:hypothetical protein R1flu_025741 [Riccia fluitans]|uniref:MutS-like protein n=1 Tax=Riccia fluitans TaxID=41844 RepID=A0ABD1XYM6_9MARC